MPRGTYLRKSNSIGVADPNKGGDRNNHEANILPKASIGVQVYGDNIYVQFNNKLSDTPPGSSQNCFTFYELEAILTNAKQLKRRQLLARAKEALVDVTKIESELKSLSK